MGDNLACGKGDFFTLSSSNCKGKEVATKYFLPGDLKLNLFLLGFPKYL